MRTSIVAKNSIEILKEVLAPTFKSKRRSEAKAEDNETRM